MRRHTLRALTLTFIMTSLAGRASATQSNYLVGPQDVLAITVWSEPELSGKFTVEADGTFTFPLIGRIKAGGLTLRALEDELRKRLLTERLLRKPHVSVAVDAYRSRRVFVVGEVRQPGAYPLTGDMRLMEALARAGSTTPSAGGEVLIIHESADEPRSGARLPSAELSDALRVDLRGLQNGSLPDNPELLDGDTIFVPPAESVYVFGQVHTPGAYVVRGDATVLQALSLAGGVTDRGSTSRIRIVRTVNGNRIELKAALSDRVRPGDTVVVLERFF